MQIVTVGSISTLLWRLKQEPHWGAAIPEAVCRSYLSGLKYRYRRSFFKKLTYPAGFFKFSRTWIVSEKGMILTVEGHHLILGELVDAVTGRILPDTHDERYRQKLAKLLMDTKGYSRTDIQSGCSLQVKAGDNCAIVKVDMAVAVADRICMIIKYGPGSLVTRHRPALAASRLLAPYQIPVVVVTNGEDADILDGRTGEVIGNGMESIPARPELVARCAAFPFAPIAEARAEIESRIVYAYEVDGACPCDDSICILPLTTVT